MEVSLETRDTILDEVRNIISHKYWYSQPFNIQTSVALLAQELNQIFKIPIESEVILRALHDCFTDNLTLIHTTGQPLVGWLNQEGYNWVIWTVGDPDWQITKAKLAGLISHQENDCELVDFWLAEDDGKGGKTSLLPGNIQTAQKHSSISTVVVIDDKPHNLAEAKQIINQSMPDLTVIDYLFKYEDSQADTHALTMWLLDIVNNKTSTILIVDMDNVLIPTNQTLYTVFSQKITDLIIKSKK